MEKFQLSILGCGCATPTTRHNPSAQLLNIRDKISLIDCGEGTQLQMRTQGVHFMKLRNIFISHTHGDHCFGLLGLISSLGLLGRTAGMHIYGPAHYEDLFKRQMGFFCDHLEYTVEYHPIDTTQYQLLFEDRSMEVYSLPLDHKMPCCGFLFKEKPTLPHIRREMIDYYKIPNSQINNIKNGQDWALEDGTVIPNNHLVRPADPVRSYAYCSDTAYCPQLIPYLKDVTLLYHEATYGKDYAHRATLYHHSTAEDAGRMAKNCGAHRLLIGHYSAHYTNEEVLLQEAQQVFPNTLAAQEGMVLNI